MRRSTGYIHDSKSKFSVAYVEVFGIGREVMFHLQLQQKWYQQIKSTNLTGQETKEQLFLCKLNHKL
jgi:hypothetical protein